MSAKHTPGPWFVAKESDAQESDGNVVISPNGYEIRPVPGVRLGDEMADLQLTAAAPELLEALKGMLAIVDDSRAVAGYHLNGELEPWGGFPEVEIARAAIAKATGSAA